jgi:DNA-binding CsgD family transcriptional regulator
MIPGRQELLTTLDQLSAAESIAALIDGTLELVESALETDVVSYNEMDFEDGSATVALRPFREDQVLAADDIGRFLDEHPIFRWYRRNDGWSPVRLSDTISFDELITTRLYVEDLDPIGARFTLIIPLTPFTETGQWTYLAANRPDRDFDDRDVQFAVEAQPGLVAAFRAFHRPATGTLLLTARERQVLTVLARGDTAGKIAYELGVSVRTVNKHLENIYGKLGSSDRLSAVLRARDLGLLREEDMSAEFRWDIHVGLAAPPADDRI